MSEPDRETLNAIRDTISPAPETPTGALLRSITFMSLLAEKMVSSGVISERDLHSMLEDVNWRR